jgi:hypothetical protein
MTTRILVQNLISREGVYSFAWSGGP